MIRFWIILFLLILANTAYALDLGIDNNKSQKIDREKSLSTKNTEEQRTSSGTKKSNTTTTGSDKNDQQIVKEVGQRQKSSVLDITLPLGNIFLPSLAMLETSKPKLKYHLLSNPRQAADFGLSAEIQPGVVDSIKADLLSKGATSNSSVTSIGGNNIQLQTYRDNLALYGVVIGQAYLNLSSDLAALNAKVTKDKDGNIVVHDLGYNDLLTLADGALLRAINKIHDRRLQKIYQSTVTDKTFCRFAGSITEIQCGSSMITISGKPTLVALGETIFSSNSFAGFTGNYKISSSWSYDQALEKLKSTTKFKKMAEEASKYADNLESKGKSRDAILIKKMALSQAKSGKTSLSLGRFIPGVPGLQ
jgi:hypothetical protein